MLKRLLPLLPAVLLAAVLPASPDWMAMPIARPLPSILSLSLGLAQSQRESWGREGGSVLLKDAEGQKVQRLLQGRMDLRWQSGPYDSWVLTVPVVFNEAALWTGAVSSPRVDDAGVDRSQGLGDLGLGWRHDRGGALGGAWGLGLGLLAPTGLGPWEAPHPLAATGEGRCRCCWPRWPWRPPCTPRCRVS